MALESKVTSSESIINAPSIGTGSSTITIGCVVVSPNGPVAPTKITTPADLLKKYTLNGVADKNTHPSLLNAYSLLQYSDLVISRSINDEVVEGITLEGTKVLVNGEKTLNTLLSIVVEIDVPAGPWHYIIGKYVFYKGAIPVGPDPINSIFVLVDNHTEVINYLNANSEFSVLSSSIIGDELTISLSTTYNTATAGTNTTFTTPLVVTTTDLSNTPFLIVSKNPLATDNLTASTTLGTGTIHTLTVNGKDYLFSLVTTDQDQFGRIVFIDWINDLDVDFYIITLDLSQAVLELPSTAFGSTNYDEVESELSSNLVIALDKVIDQEKYRLDVLSDLGMVKSSFQAALVTRGTIYGYFCPLSLPPTITDYQQLQSYVSATGINSSQAHWITPSEKNISLFPFQTIISGAVKYLERLALNKLANIEFAPILGKNNGRINAGKLTYNFTKPERESMLDFKINTIVNKEDQNIVYINDNLTGQSSKDMMSEDQNRRLGNKIANDLRVIYEQFLGELNVQSTRDSVESVTKAYFRLRILNQKYSIDSFLVICNSTNNTPEVITENKLAVTVKVKYNNAVKYVEVLNEAYSLGVNF